MQKQVIEQVRIKSEECLIIFNEMAGFAFTDQLSDIFEKQTATAARRITGVPFEIARGPPVLYLQTTTAVRLWREGGSRFPSAMKQITLTNRSQMQRNTFLFLYKPKMLRGISTMKYTGTTKGPNIPYHSDVPKSSVVVSILRYTNVLRA